MNTQKIIEEEIKRIMNSEVVKFANSMIVQHAVRRGTKGYMGKKNLEDEIRESIAIIISQQETSVREERFKELWGTDGHGTYWNDPNCSAENVAEFIKQEKEKSFEDGKIKGMRTEQNVEIGKGLLVGWNQAIDKAVEKLEEGQNGFYEESEFQYAKSLVIGLKR